MPASRLAAHTDTCTPVSSTVTVVRFVRIESSAGLVGVNAVRSWASRAESPYGAGADASSRS